MSNELTPEEIDDLLVLHGKGDDGFHSFAKAVIAAHEAKRQAKPSTHPILYQHSDGRTALVDSPEQADFAVGDPEWHRVGPVDIVRMGCVMPPPAAHALLADLREAAATLRRYEKLHRAKGTDDSTAKAEVNATLAARFEATIAQAVQP